MRARDLGVVIGEHPPGPDNAITDVAGVRVGHTTLQADGRTAVRTGVTVVVPHDDIWTEPVFAGSHRLNGSGEMTGLDWVRESGELTTAIGLTNTHSVGVVRDELVAAQVRARGEGLYWSLPVVGETYDGLLNDINGFHVRPDHVRAALDHATAAPPTAAKAPVASCNAPAVDGEAQWKGVLEEAGMVSMSRLLEVTLSS